MVLPTLLFYSAASVVILTVVLVLLYYTHPTLLFEWYMRYQLYSSGLCVRYVKNEERTYCYAERGTRTPDRSSILFIHGFTASKDMWVPLVKLLPKNLHIVAVDLAGHGHTTQVPGEDISFLGQIKTLHQFVELIGLNSAPYHVIGQSMGGAMAGLYAAHYGHEVDKVTLICPAMKTPVETEFIHELRSGHCRLIPKEPEEVQYMIDSTLYNKRRFPKQILKAVIKTREPYNDFFHELYTTLATDEEGEQLIQHAEKITVPSQIIWGEHDELVHVSGFDVLKKALPNCQKADVIERCGHSTNMDRPGMVVKLLLQFRGEYIKTNRKSKAQ
ncbi:monoacylglycerol lipase ABHD6 [Lingula anatina]|uniref:acylglycerol lipase n=1 Tax=Lingula anatina TaxID=7574 RepID=A0A1S3H5P9_LINAN|nr:monoacylglycerol lipase ABHD6 [Lingula anatina]|eukprot:XP_013380459.1 monoacylglycerol lipase ABHD6 [Lingula anatina]